MNWLKDLFQAIKSVFELLKQNSDPENKRLRTIEDYEKELERKQKQKVSLIKQQLEETDEDKKHEKAIELGNITDRIVWLRRKISNLKR